MQGFHIRIRFRFLFVWNDAKISSWPPCVPITFGGSTPIIDKTDIIPNTFPTSSISLFYTILFFVLARILLKCSDEIPR